MSSSTEMKLAEYLFTRLRQLGVGSVHGVPGDYNLTLLDYVEPSGLHWVGNANELNAGYAADGYARIKGVGAIITTFGVGELSAINAIAGAYTERAAVVHIVGTPPRDSQDNRRLIHHTFNDGEYRRFGNMAAQVTIAQASLRDPRMAPKQIDDVLQECILHSRPVYIEVPVDLVSATVSKERLQSEIRIPEVLPTSNHEAAISEVLNKLYSAKQPYIFVDGEVRAMRIVEELNSLVSSTNWPTWGTSYSKGLVSETLPSSHGINRGSYADAQTKNLIDNSDLVLCFGPHFSWTNSYGGSSVPDLDKAILFTDTEIKFKSQTFRDIPAKYALSQILKRLDYSKIKKYEPYPDIPKDHTVPFTEVQGEQYIKQDKVWRILGNFLQPGDILFAETGTAGYGCRDMPLPQHTTFFSPVTWLSIGYMLPAAQGAALAQRELLAESKYHNLKKGRTVLFIGDGSFQMTAQELATIIREKLDVVLFLINNDGYTIERCIHGIKERYNDISAWRYLQGPSFFGASKDTYTGSAKTWGELQNALSDKTVTDGQGLRMVEVVMDREDAPTGLLLDMINKQKANMNGGEEIRG